jgi:nucleoside 2-deoxyribosyltransferase
MKTLYLAGPMRGHKYYNFDAFLSAEADLRDMGFNVYNPARIDMEAGFDPYSLPCDWDWHALPEGSSMEEYMARDLPLVMKSDAVACLPEWSGSSGASAEVAVANACGKDVYEYENGELWKLNVILHRSSSANPRDILEEAYALTTGDRNAQYGPPDQDFRRTAAMWSALFGREFKSHEVAMAMACLKLSRLTHSLKRDSVVDLAGYARCLDVCVSESGGYPS